MLSSFRARLGVSKYIAIFTLLYLISQSIIAYIIHPMDPMLFLKAQTTFSKTVYLELLNQWETAQVMNRYRLHFYFDFIHPFLYAFLLAALIAKGLNLNKAPVRYNLLLLMPFAAGLMDLVENCYHLRFITDSNSITQGSITVSALAANIKWGLAGLSIALSVILFTKFSTSEKK